MVLPAAASILKLLPMHPGLPSHPRSSKMALSSPSIGIQTQYVIRKGECSNCLANAVLLVPSGAVWPGQCRTNEPQNERSSFQKLEHPENFACIRFAGSPSSRLLHYIHHQDKYRRGMDHKSWSVRRIGAHVIRHLLLLSRPKESSTHIGCQLSNVRRTSRCRSDSLLRLLLLHGYHGLLP